MTLDAPASRHGVIDQASPSGAWRWHRFGSAFLASQIPLTALPEADAPHGNDAVIITIDWTDIPCPDSASLIHAWLEGTDTVLQLVRDDQTSWLQVPGVADFKLQADPLRVSVHLRVDAIDANSLEHQLVDQVLPRLLDQLGHLVVHASAVVIGERVALFLGPSGIGKSTLAGLLHQRGHQLLSDDCVQVISTEAGLQAIATYPSLRLLEDSLAVLNTADAPSTAVSDYSGKRRLPMPESTGDGRHSIDAIYILETPPEDGSSSIAPLSAAEACLALIRHSFRFELGNRIATVAHLGRCSAVARSIPAFELRYPRDFTRHDAIANAIKNHLAALPQPARTRAHP